MALMDDVYNRWPAKVRLSPRVMFRWRANVEQESLAHLEEESRDPHNLPQMKGTLGRGEGGCIVASCTCNI